MEIENQLAELPAESVVAPEARTPVTLAVQVGNRNFLRRLFGRIHWRSKVGVSVAVAAFEQIDNEIL